MSARKREVGIHLEIGRRYKHRDATPAPRTRGVRHKSAVFHHALEAVMTRYASELDEEELEALHDAVVRLLRPELRTEWSREQGVQRALTIAAGLLDDAGA